MKVLFDHNLPHTLRTIRRIRCQHEIVTTAFMRWTNLKNGELLRAPKRNGIGLAIRQ